jgi:hypothetical protein
MRQPFALADSSAVAGLMEDAGLRQIEVSHHTRLVRFERRDDFGRALVLATPLAQAFIDAPDDRQELIVAHVNAAARECAGARTRFSSR